MELDINRIVFEKATLSDVDKLNCCILYVDA